MKKISYMKLAIFFLMLFLALNIPLSECWSDPNTRIWNLSNPNSFFVGREGKINQMSSFFAKGGHILAITGGPGFGKTQIAKKYAQQFQKEYKIIWWIDVQQDIPSQFEKLALSLNSILPAKEKIEPSTLSKDALVDRVKDILRVKNIRYLIIFDNAETYAQLEKYIPYVSDSAGAHILLTSRHANIWTDRVEVGKFERKESISLIKKTLSKEKDQDVQRLAESLSDYPLGLTLAIGFIKSSPTTTIDKYLAMHMKRTLKKGDEMPNSISDSYSKDALAALEISLKSIEEKSKDALKTLFFMSLLNSKDIPESYVELWLKNEGSDLTADEAIKHVYGQSLIEVSETNEFKNQQEADKEGRSKIHYLSFHDLIHQLINEKLPIKEKKELIEKATEVILEVFSGNAETFTKRILNERIHLLHAQKLCEKAKQIGYSSKRLLQLKVCMLECICSAMRDFETAKIYLKEIDEDLKNNFTLDPYYKALLILNKGFFESLYNPNYDKAIQHMKDGLSILITQDGYYEEKLRAISNLVQFYVLRGETDLAEEFIKKGTVIFENSTPKGKGFFIFVWSLFLNSQQQYEKSIRILEKTKEYSTLNKDYPMAYHSILYQTIETLIRQHKFKEAQEKIREFEKSTQGFFNKRKNTMRANALLFKSVIAVSEKKNILETIQNLSEAICVFDECFHGENKHRNQARAHLVLGKALLSNKELRPALKEYIKSEEIYNILLKNRRIDDVSDLYKELAILGAKLKDEQLIHKYLGAHIDIFGHGHPRTQEIILYLDKEGIGIPF